MEDSDSFFSAFNHQLAASGSPNSSTIYFVFTSLVSSDLQLSSSLLQCSNVCSFLLSVKARQCILRNFDQISNVWPYFDQFHNFDQDSQLLCKICNTSTNEGVEYKETKIQQLKELRSNVSPCHLSFHSEKRSESDLVGEDGMCKVLSRRMCTTQAT